MKLTQNFTLNELVYSVTAEANKIDNRPNVKVVANLKALCENVLQPLRNSLGCPVIVSSGFRCAELNKRIGGAANSGHLTGRCADIHVNGMTAKELYNFIKKSGVKYRQCILESNSWVHIDYKKDDLKCENLIYDGKSYVLDK